MSKLLPLDRRKGRPPQLRSHVPLSWSTARRRCEVLADEFMRILREWPALSGEFYWDVCHACHEWICLGPRDNVRYCSDACRRKIKREHAHQLRQLREGLDSHEAKRAGRKAKGGAK